MSEYILSSPISRIRYWLCRHGLSATIGEAVRSAIAYNGERLLVGITPCALGGRR